MSLFDLLISGIAPYECLACGAEGHLLCGVCLAGLPDAPRRCYRCYKPSPAWLTCPGCRLTSKLRRVGVATIYDGKAKDLIWKLKLSGARVAARIMAERLEPLVERINGTAIVPVPTATGRARQRGYDQAKLLARELGRRTGLPYRDCLARHGQAHQHGLSRRERLTQLAGSYRATRQIRGGRIVLVDDVITTGGTLEAAATALADAGAVCVDAVVFAQPNPNWLVN